MKAGRVVRYFLAQPRSSPLPLVSGRLGSAVTRDRPRSTAPLALLVLAAFLWVAPWYLVPAVGSCAETQIRSPYSFTGVVVSTRSQGRVATVRTDTGATVQVLGTTANGSGATSVDRSYEVGGRYEFHPTNGSSPYQDNACTFTHLLSSGAEPSPPTSEPAAATNRRALIVAGVSGFAVLGIAGALAVLRRRHLSDAALNRTGRAR